MTFCDKSFYFFSMQLKSKSVLTLLSMVLFLTSIIETNGQSIPQLTPSEVCSKSFYGGTTKSRTFKFKVHENALEYSGALNQKALNKILSHLSEGSERFTPNGKELDKFGGGITLSITSRIVYVRQADGDMIRAEFVSSGKKGFIQARIVFVKSESTNGW